MLAFNEKCNPELHLFIVIYIYFSVLFFFNPDIIIPILTYKRACLKH
jgi:hypothetical protein